MVWGTSRSLGGPQGVWGELGKSGGFQGVWGTSGRLGDLRESEGTSGSLGGPQEVWRDLGESGGNLGSLGGLRESGDTSGNLRGLGIWGITVLLRETSRVGEPQGSWGTELIPRFSSWWDILHACSHVPLPTQ